MNINRHNYEEYFLLYVDNELSAADRKAVDLFIAENPDLRQELTILQQTILEPGSFVFDAKAGLQKSEAPTPLQEDLLSYLDNELSAPAKTAMEALLARQEEVRAELNSLQRTLLEPETIVFADKASLYRHEEGARVIRIKWWQIAAAALLLGFGTWTGIRFYMNSGTQPGGNNPVALATDKKAANNTNTEVNPANTPSGNNGNLPANTNTAELANNKTNPVPGQSLNPAAGITGDKATAPVAVKNRRPSSPSEENVAAVDNVPEKKPSNNLPRPYFENINNRAGNETVAANVTPKNESNNGINSGNDNPLPSSNNRNPYTNKLTDANSTPGIASNNAAIPAVYNPDNNDRLVDLQDERGKRSKLGGFLRKVKRTLERTANIKTGDEVKVAGFEIAIK
ncbi:MAG: hypothetical protein U0X40_01120 [Ferruginibacter sp.]